jgi:cell division transport system permease protein
VLRSSLAVIHFLAFSVRRAVEGLWRNRVMSLAATVTMVLMLVLVAGLVLLLAGMEAGLTAIESKVEIRAQLHRGVDRARVDELIARVEALPEVASVTYVSEEQALAEYRAQRAADGRPDYTELVGENPLPARLVVKLKDPREFGQVRTTLEATTALVEGVDEEQADVDQLISIIAMLRTIGLVVVGIVGLTVLLIVVNSIRMAVMSRADEIEVMRLVGASAPFVRWPFIFEGLLVGLVGAFVALGLLGLGSAPISQLANAMGVGFSRQLATELVAIVLAAGLGLGGLGAWISVRAYLRD